MAVVHILSAGAAQAVVENIAAAYTRETGNGVKANMQYFPNGHGAMKWLAESRGRSEIGITQITEILANKGVTYAGPLPGDLQTKTIYSAGLSARVAEPGMARDFVARLTSPAARDMLAQAGYQFDT